VIAKICAAIIFAKKPKQRRCKDEAMRLEQNILFLLGQAKKNNNSKIYNQ
jgi:hypothetical protein